MTQPTASATYMPSILAMFGDPAAPLMGLSVAKLASLSGKTEAEVLTLLKNAGIENPEADDFLLLPDMLTANPAKTGALKELLSKAAANPRTPDGARALQLFEALDLSVSYADGPSPLLDAPSLARFDRDHDNDIDADDFAQMTDPAERAQCKAELQVQIDRLKNELQSAHSPEEKWMMELQLADLTHLIESTDENSVDLGGDASYSSILASFDQNHDAKLDGSDIQTILSTGSPEHARALRSGLTLAMQSIQAKLNTDGRTMAPSEREALLSEFQDISLLLAKTGVVPLTGLSANLDLTPFDADNDGYLTVADVAYLPPDQRAALAAKLNDPAFKQEVQAHIDQAAPGSQERELWTKVQQNMGDIVQQIAHPSVLNLDALLPDPNSVPKLTAAAGLAGDPKLLEEADIAGMSSQQLKDFVEGADLQLAATVPPLTPEARAQLSQLRNVAIAKLLPLAAPSPVTHQPADAVAAAALTATTRGVDPLNPNGTGAITIRELLFQLAGIMSRLRFDQRGTNMATALSQFNTLVNAAKEQKDADVEKALGEIISAAVSAVGAVLSGVVGGYTLSRKAPELEQPMSNSDTKALAKFEAELQNPATSADRINEIKTTPKYMRLRQHQDDLDHLAKLRSGNVEIEDANAPIVRDKEGNVEPRPKIKIGWEDRFKDPEFGAIMQRHQARVQDFQSQTQTLSFMGQPVGQGLQNVAQGVDDMGFKIDAADMEQRAKVLQAFSDLIQRMLSVGDQDEQQMQELSRKFLESMESIGQQLLQQQF